MHYRFKLPLMSTSYRLGYQAGYYTGRAVTKIVKFYVSMKVFEKTVKTVDQISKTHSIDSKNPAVVTQNIFDCLEYLD